MIVLLMAGTLSISLIQTSLSQQELGQVSRELDVKSQEQVKNPMEMLESLGSPNDLMDSVMNTMRPNSSLDDQVGDRESIVYSQAESLTLSHQVIPAKDFIHLYSTSPFTIFEGFITAKLPCNTDNSTNLRVLVGQLPTLRPAILNMENDLSKPGYMCLYKSDIRQNSTGTTSVISDIILFNASDERIVLPNTSTFLIGITKLSHGHEDVP